MSSELDSKILEDTNAREYESTKNRLFVIQIFYLFALLAIFLFFGFSQSLANNLINHFGSDFWLITNISYIASVILGISVFLFPFSYYNGYVLESYYNLSNQSFGSWGVDYAKSLLIDLIVLSFLINVLYIFLRLLPEVWWLVGTGFYLLFSLVFSFITPILIFPIFYNLEPLEDSNLEEKVSNVVKSAGIKISGVYCWGLADKTKTANAAFVGIGRTKRIILSDTLLDNYSDNEILAVVAHEVGHCKNYDIMRLIILNTLLSFAGFYLADLFLQFSIKWVNLDSIYDISGLPLLFFGVMVFSIISMPIFNGYSRKREFAADAYVVDTSGTAENLISALNKLSKQNLSVRDPNKWIEFFLHSHPSVKKRVEYAQARALKNYS